MNNNREKIAEALRESPRGLTISKISEAIGVNRITVSKYVCAMVAEGLVEQREIGPAKLCFLKEV